MYGVLPPLSVVSTTENEVIDNTAPPGQPGGCVPVSGIPNACVHATATATSTPNDNYYLTDNGGNTGNSSSSGSDVGMVILRWALSITGSVFLLVVGLYVSKRYSLSPTQGAEFELATMTAATV